MEKRDIHVGGGETMLYNADIALKITKHGIETIRNIQELMKENEIEEKLDPNIKIYRLSSNSDRRNPFLYI